MKSALSIVLAGLTMSALAPADNWPHWRGPSFYGVSDETNLPVEWSDEKNITWKLPLPAWSGSTPIIWGDHIFLNVAESGSIYLWAIDRTEGEVLWKKHLSDGDEKRRKQNMSTPSPVTDGSSVWVMTGTGILARFDFDGNENWRRNIQQDYGSFGLNHGYANSPLLYQGDLIVPVLHGMLTDDPSYVLRIDGATGETKWRVERPTDAIRESPDSYTTPAVVGEGDEQRIVITGGDYVTGHDPATGREVWRGGGLNPQNNPAYRIVASPIVNDGLIYVPTRKNPLQAYRAGGRGDITESHLVWKFTRGPDVPSPVTDGAYFYVIDDGGIVHCLNPKTGETIWGPERIPPATYSSSPVLADGKIYMSNEDGQTVVLRAGPKFEQLAVNQLDGYTLSSPAISDGQIFLRTEKFLYCVGERRQ